jgi:type IV secretion system protein VirB4
VLLGFLVAQLTKFGASQVIFDKDRGLEILVRALGGAYLPIRAGVASGMNPLQLPVTPENVEFLRSWLRVLVGSSRALTVREEADLDNALAGTLGLAPAARRLSRLSEFLDPTDAEGVGARLARWCERPDRLGRAGEDAWVFDNAVDEVAALLGAAAWTGADEKPAQEARGRSREHAEGDHRLTAIATRKDSMTVGFDVTAFLDTPRLREPVALYLFHLVRLRLDGRRTVVWMDEFSRLLADPGFEAFAKDGLKTWRKLNGVAAFATQSPSDVIGSAIARTLIEQSPTKIFFPNPDAAAVDYCDGFGLTERELALVRDELAPGSRRFLVKQGHDSVVCELDLKGMALELAVISGRLANVTVVDRLRAECGAAPGEWLPRFGEYLTERMEA